MIINLQNAGTIDLLKKQAVKLKREERTREEQVKIIRYLIPFYQGLDSLLEDEEDIFKSMNQIYEKVRAR